jgi:hypothetical protein
MSERPSVDAKDLPAEVRRRLGLKIKVKRERSMTMHEVRTYAIRVLAVMADLTPAERSRVLRQAGRMNEV